MSKDKTARLNRLLNNGRCLDVASTTASATSRASCRPGGHGEVVDKLVAAQSPTPSR
jgi:hypothetical protein